MWFLRVPARWLNQCVSRFYATGLLSLLDHPHGDPVLDAPASVEELAFCVDGSFDAERLRDFVKADEGSLADELERGEVGAFAIEAEGSAVRRSHFEIFGALYEGG